MVKTPNSITVDIRVIPEVRELLAEVWDEGFRRGYSLRRGDSDMNPYRTEARDGDG